ncbi:hypothetical protein BDN70DRAFT_853837 [Pholiota conissans]|uniref:Xylanolytic transcriptional activator regulatory domain-containing protein n=1 Tax=Pholiota conissans TaxID=109636 RepID=A0A9P5Z7A2_9AGAR|nr:hypothetical protein BDN70DRAFT_853837 [Pholiota conissans]
MITESENTVHSPPSPNQDLKPKKRRLHGACDACRRKKGDSAKMPDKVCTNCRIAGVQCGHTIARHAKKKDPQASYIRNLEERLERMERSFQEANMRPDNEPTREGSTASEETHHSSPSAGGTSSSKSAVDAAYSKHPALKSIIAKFEPGSPNLSPSDDSSEVEDLAHVALTESMNQLSIANMEHRYFGQASAFMFLKQTSTVKSEITGAPDKLDPKTFRRPLYWDIRPWELNLATSNEPVYVYPAEDLLKTLVLIYFEKVNLIYPILHEPTFRKMLSEKQHLWDTSFGMTVLLVCANASRYSSDPRAMLPGDGSGLSSGWHWFSQVPIHRNPLFYKSTIYDLQYFVLASLYLTSTSVPHTAWTVLGLAMRIAQEKGIHRRQGNNQKPTVEGELRKRAFWCMVGLDRVVASFLGRPCIMQDEDFDVDYPVECDDEYWETEDPDQAFKQPPGKPCKIASFICNLKICEIIAVTLKTLYSTKKFKVTSGQRGDEWERLVVLQLDSSMNKWKDTLPQHLSWEPIGERETMFFDQAVNLHALYYYTQVLIHRPFLTKKSVLSFPSLAMCTNAARSCGKLLETVQDKPAAPYNLIIAAFSTGLVLVLNLWGHQRSGLFNRPSSELEGLQRCNNLLKECEKRYRIAGRFRDMLEAISSFDDFQPIASTPYVSPPNVSYQPKMDVQPPFSHETLGPIHINNPSPFASVQPPAVGFPLPNAAAQQNNFGVSPSFAPQNSWDLNNLLLFQMGITQSNLGDNMDVYTNDNMYPTGIIAPESNIFEGIKAGNASLPGPNMMTDEMLSLWSEIPAAFSVDEWNAYLSSMGSTSASN